MRFIYMLRAGESHYKVGITTNVVKRVKSIQTSNQHLIEVVTTRPVSNAEVVEQELHFWLRKYQSGGGTEWFELSAEQAMELVIKIGSIELEGDLSNYLALRNLKSLYDRMEKKMAKMGEELDRFKANQKSVEDIDIESATEIVGYERDELFEVAVDIVRMTGRASASLLQRRLRIGYARAARLIDDLEEEGIVKAADGARPREIISQ